jgi:hypothetical protein
MVIDNEQRKYIRVPFKAAAILWSLKQDAKEIRCDQTRDISFKGIYCYSDIKFSVGTICDLELHLTDTSSKLVLFSKGRVVRTDDEGMGIKFEEMELDSFLLLKNIVTENTENSKQIDRELTGYIHKD